MKEYWVDVYTLISCRDGTKSGGAFEFDQLNGIIRVGPPPSKDLNAPLPCFWRGRAGGEGEMTWEELECTGELLFLAGSKIMECLTEIDNVELPGTLDAEMMKPAKIVKDMEKGWQGYNETAHGRELANQWRGRQWHKDEEDEDDKGGFGLDGSIDWRHPIPESR